VLKGLELTLVSIDDPVTSLQTDEVFVGGITRGAEEEVVKAIGATEDRFQYY
jgi:hypothetical protein